MDNDSVCSNRCKVVAAGRTTPQTEVVFGCYGDLRIFEGEVDEGCRRAFRCCLKQRTIPSFPLFLGGWNKVIHSPSQYCLHHTRCRCLQSLFITN